MVACVTPEPLREDGGGVLDLMELWETDESLREVGSVMEDSSSKADEMRLDAELKKEEPNPKPFPVTAETAGWGDGDWDRAPTMP